MCNVRARGGHVVRGVKEKEKEAGGRRLEGADDEEDPILLA